MAATLTKRTLAAALAELGEADPDLAAARRRVGTPPLRRSRAGFASMMRIIMAQQVSTASARAIFGRLEEATHPLTPETFLALDDAALRAIGLSRQKVGYGRGLAHDVVAGRLDFDRLKRLDDEAAIAELVAVKGVGRWTAEIYLMFVLKRADIWPAADLGLAQAVQQVKRLRARPDAKRMTRLGERWRPWRSAASLLLWHYLHKVPTE